MSDPLRILCLSNMHPGPDDPDYGAFVAAMCEALGRRGHAVERAVIDHRASGPLRTPAKYARLARDARAAARGCDVVYAHYLFPTGAIAAGVAARGGPPFVVTAHGRDVRNLARGSVRRMTAAALARAGAVIAVSEHLADELRSTDLRLPPLHVAHMGVDLDRFRPGDRGAARAELGLPADGPLILAVGGLTERKNPLALLLAFARLTRDRPDARLAFVGDGPMAGAIDVGAARLGVRRRVIRAGALPHERVPRWMAAADVLAMVSRVEPLGVVALEALASGRPVVATRVGGAREVVPASGAGAVVDPADPAAIAEALATLIDRPPSAGECRRAAEPHGVDRQAGRVARILAGVAGRDPGTA